MIPAPYWASYPDMVRLAGGAPVLLPADAERHFRPAPEQLEAALTERTRLLILNSPSNPCGTMLRRSDLEGYAEVLRAHPQVRIASDDIYELIRYDGREFVNLVQAAPDLRDRVLVFNGVSKAYAMTGWRIGYAAGPAEVIRAMRNIQSQSTSNPCSIAQAAAAAALADGAGSAAAMVTAFRERRDYLVAALDALPGMSCRPPDGAFYCLPDVRGMMARAGCGDDAAFASLLLEELHLAGAGAAVRRARARARVFRHRPADPAPGRREIAGALCLNRRPGGTWSARTPTGPGATGRWRRNSNWSRWSSPIRRGCARPNARRCSRGCTRAAPPATAAPGSSARPAVLALGRQAGTGAARPPSGRRRRRGSRA